MKKMIYKPIKVLILVILTAGIAFFTYSIIHIFSTPVFSEQKELINELHHKADVGYEVLLKSNILYNEPSLGMGMSYITEYVDRIKTQYTYNLKSLNDAEIKGSYNIYALVEGFLEEKEKPVTIWQKKFPIKDINNIDYIGKSLSVSEDVYIDLSEYNEFAKEVIETSRVICDVRLIILMDINLNILSQDKEISKEITPFMSLKLNSNLFTIDGNLSYSDIQTIDNSQKIAIPTKPSKVILYAIPLFVFIVGALFLLIRTEGYIYKDPYLKEIKKIFKEHGERLVALKDITHHKGRDQISVKSFFDLVRLSDELGRPIMYHFSENKSEITEFFVSDHQVCYSYRFSNINQNPDDPDFTTKGGKDYTQDILRLKAEGKLYT